jgi:CRP-like cAMP-binding protein
MVEAITRKLHRFEALEPDDAAALGIITHTARSYNARCDMISAGSKPGFVLVILRGWAARYIILKNGSRQITTFLLPGDFCHLNILSDQTMDHSILAISPVMAARVGRDEVEDLFTAHPAIARAVQASQFADESRLRASITNIGRQGAAQRVGYMLCDLWVRAGAVGLIDNNCLSFQLTQVDIADIADSVGLTAVHVNRVIQRLHGDGLLHLKDRLLSLPNFNGLARLSGYATTATGSDRHYQPRIPNSHADGLRDQAPELTVPF